MQLALPLFPELARAPHPKAPAPRRLLLLACSATKSATTEPAPALELYQGPLWQTLRAADPEGRKARACVVSARYGLREARFHRLANYDQRLSRQVAAAMIEGGVGQRWPRDHRPGRMPAGVAPGCEMASLSAYGREPFEAVALCGGGLYLEVMRAWLAEFRELGAVEAAADVVEINGPIGYMRRDLRAWLEA